MYLCFHLQGHKICFRVPVLAPGPLGPGDPIEKPQPDPWFTDNGIAPKVAHQLSAIATIQAASTHLSPALRASAQAEVERAIAQVHSQLPAGTEIAP